MLFILPDYKVICAPLRTTAVIDHRSVVRSWTELHRIPQSMLHQIAIPSLADMMQGFRMRSGVNNARVFNPDSPAQVAISYKCLYDGTVTK